MTATRWNRLARSSSSPPHAAITCASDLPCNSGSIASAHTPNAAVTPSGWARANMPAASAWRASNSRPSRSAHPGLARQQDDTELPRRGPGELIVQHGHLVAAADQRQPGSWHQPDSGPAPRTDQGSQRRPARNGTAHAPARCAGCWWPATRDRYTAWTSPASR